MDDLTIYKSLEKAYKKDLEKNLLTNQNFSSSRRRCWNQVGEKVILDNFILKCKNIGIKTDYYAWAIELSNSFDMSSLYSD